MSKNFKNTAKSVEKPEKRKKIEIHQKCRKSGKTIKNVEKPVKTRQKYRKIVKNVEKLGKNRQKCKKTVRK